MFEDENDMISEVAGAAANALANVTFHLEVDDVDAQWGIQSVSLREAVSEAYRGIVEAVVDVDPPDIPALLGKKFSLRIERGDEQRTVRGIVRHALAGNAIVGMQYTLHVVPSIWRLGLGLDTRTYRDVKIPDLVQQVIQERLGRAVEVDIGNLTQTYETHEFLIQYQESAWNFISRWMEQEGIFFFLADAEDNEKLVLADAMDNLPFARPGDDGRVAHRGPTAIDATETVLQLRHTEEIGVTSVAVADFDWTNPSLGVTAQRTGASALDPAPEVYDHTDVVSFHRYGGQQYEHNTADRGAQIRSEVLALQRQRWAMRGGIVTAQPGHVLRVEGAPQSDLDGSYMIVRCESGGLATEGETGTWENSFVLVPTSLQYRTSPRTPRPVVPGPETAIVVGPEGQEIHTDGHGRVKVHFHWDRVQGRTDEQSSFWIRVQHNWAGPGFGTFFLPRVGMEVVVAFLGGHPDRPLITGCVYNGTNASPAHPLPAKKTQSVIRTKSSQNSDGYNEIRFEDDAGSEFISVHAQKNLMERVLNDHTTRVGHDQTNTVDNDQTETIHGKREKTVDKDEKITVKGKRDATIGQDGGDEELWVINNQNIQVDGNRELRVAFGETVEVCGIQDLTIGSITSTVRRGITQTIEAGGWTMTTTGNVGHTITGGMVVDTSDGVTINAGASVSIDGAQGVTVSGKSIALRSNTQVEVVGPKGISNLTPARRQNTSPSTMDTISDWIIDGGRKLAMYYLSVSIVTGMKVDVVMGVKVDNTRIKARLADMQIENASGVWLRKAAISILA